MYVAYIHVSIGASSLRRVSLPLPCTITYPIAVLCFRSLFFTAPPPVSCCVTSEMKVLMAYDEDTEEEGEGETETVDKKDN